MHHSLILLFAGRRKILGRWREEFNSLLLKRIMATFFFSAVHARMVVLRGKCVVVGDPAVGKSALSQVFHSDGSHFPKTYNMVCLFFFFFQS
jgi:hypothetical protein